ncbi:MAG TPA: TonB-dependent receptor, partial [Xanthomonadaceae bacterium]|nr:TonB-dependent receptor [Xanthomonadaceae bacterium]
MYGMKRALLTTAICAGLLFERTAWASETAAPPESSDQTQSPAPSDGTKDNDNTKDNGKDKKKAKTLDAVTVTGSLIPQSQLQTASPVITITAQDIERQGFKTVYDALHALPIATGSVEDSQYQGSNTQAANTVSLFGLDPGFTLVLINGHPVADYPIPYKGTGNIVDLATIPTTMVDRIDILSGGQSSLYGSSAIAGVINIVLKKHTEGMDVSLRGGSYTEGGGQNERASLSGGSTYGDLDINYAIQLDNQRPIWGFERSFADSALDDPSGQGFPHRVFFRQVGFGGAYLDPGQARCAAVGDLFGGTVSYDLMPGQGYYCGSTTEPGYNTLMNSNRDVDAYLNLDDHLNDYNDLYAEIEYSYSRPTIGFGSQFWNYTNPLLAHGVNGLTDYFWNNTTQELEYWQRLIAPEEMGGLNVDEEKVLTRQYNVNVGSRGAFGQTDWTYDAYYNRSEVGTSSSQLWPLNAPLIKYYLGNQQGTDPYGYGLGVPAYTPNLQHFYTPLTPAQFLAFSDYIKSQSVSWTQNATAVVTNPDLFQLPSGPVGIAGVVQYGDQAFNNPVDPRVQAGDFVGQFGTSGAGARDHMAIGSELRVPVFKQLVADASVRYDDYKTDFREDSKPTYKMGLEYRPWDSLLLRATYATAFRAPDMEYLFAKDSGLEESVTDWYQCRSTPPTTPIDQCPNSWGEYVFALNSGSNALKSVTSQSFGYGLVFSPTDRFNLKLDYQHIVIDNEIQPLDSNALLFTEANCRIGMTPGGQSVDVNSPTCLDAIARVVRYPANYPVTAVANQIEEVLVGPVNIASESLDGIQSSADYKFDIGR